MRRTAAVIGTAIFFLFVPCVLAGVVPWWISRWEFRLSEAWSVVVKGTARVLDQGQEIADAEALNLKTWVPTLKDFYVEITPLRITGRHFNFGEQPERF